MRNFKEFLQKRHYKLLSKEELPSRFIEEKEYQILFIRIFALDNKKLSLDTRCFIIIENDVYEFLRDKKRFIQISSCKSFYEVIENILSDYESILDGYDEVLDGKEDELYRRKIKPLFLNDWFDLKRDVTKAERVLIRLEQVLTHMQKYRHKLPYILMLVEETSALKRYASLQLSKLDTLYNYFYSLKNDKMNERIFLLTIISAIFLPINLVVGFFGINTQNLFFSANPQGTWYVVYIIISIFLFMILLLPVYHFIRNIIFYRVLGQSKLYRHLKNFISRQDDNSV